MKAAILRSADSVPVYGDFDEPAAGQDSQIVGLVAAGIHQLTRSVAAGRHYGRDPVFPVIPGLNAVQFAATEAAAKAVGFEAEILEVRSPEDFEGALEAARIRHADAGVLLSSPLVHGQ